MSATGDQIRRARRLAKLSIKGLADATGVSERQIGRIERGEREAKKDGDNPEAGDETASVAILRDYLGLSGDPEEEPPLEDVARLTDGQLLAQRRLIEAEWERRYFAVIAEVEELRAAARPAAAPRRGLPATPPLPGADSPKRPRRLESGG